MKEANNANNQMTDDPYSTITAPPVFQTAPHVDAMLKNSDHHNGWSASDENLIKSLLFDDALAGLLLIKQPEVQTTFTVNFEDYFALLYKILAQKYSHWLTKTDLQNWLILIDDERENEAWPYVSSTGLARFGKRFGPWTNIVANVRDFISSGASQWFHGKYVEDANTSLPIDSANKKYFFIHSVSFDVKTCNNNLIPVFYLSYRDGDERPSHQYIYTNPFHQLCVIIPDNNLMRTECFNSIRPLIEKIVGNNAIPVPKLHSNFQNLTVVSQQI